MQARRALVLLLLSCAAAAPAAEPPPTRAEEWAALRRAKAEAPPRPYRPAWLERQILALEKRERPGIFELNLHGLYPRVQGIASGSQVAFGTRFWRPDVAGTPLDVHASAFQSIRDYRFFDLQAGLLPHRGARFPPRSTRDDDVYELGDVRRPAGRAVAYVSVRHRHEPRTAFYGLGGGTSPRAETSFLIREAQAEAVLGRQWTPRLVTTVRAGGRWPEVGPGRGDRPSTETRFDDAAAPGLDGQRPFATVGAFVLADGRDEPGNPHRGAVAAFGVTRFSGRGDQAFDFTRLAADARAYLPLGSPQRVLAARAYASRDRAGAGARVPFYLQEALGGPHSLRAYPSFRFRGEKVLSLQAEYRWEAWPALELALFADAGRAFRAEEALELRAFETAWGLGVRLKTHERVLGHLDVAFGDEGARVRLRLGPSF